MTQISRTTPTKTHSSNEIIQIITPIEWGLLGNSGEPPPLTTSELWYTLPSELAYTSTIRDALARNLDRWQSESYFYLFECFCAIGLDVREITLQEWEKLDIEFDEEDSSEIHEKKREKLKKRDEAVYFVWDQDELLRSETPIWVKIILSMNMMELSGIDQAQYGVNEKYSESQQQAANFDQLYIDLSSLIHYITQPFTKRIPEHIPKHIRPTPDAIKKVDLQRMEEQIDRIHFFYLFCLNKKKSLIHPLAPIIRAWLQLSRGEAIENATVDHAGHLTPIPYIISEVNRRRWNSAGSVDAIEVDGEPIVTHLATVPPHAATLKQIYKPGQTKGKVYLPKGSEGQFEYFPPRGRQTMHTPLPLVAYGEFGGDLRESLASDVAQVITIAFSANEPLRLTLEEGAKLLSRNLQGEMRRAQPPDLIRFERAFEALHGMAAWVIWEKSVGGDGLPHFMPFVNTTRDAFNNVSIAAPKWLSREQGRWTLSAGFGIAGKNRLKGQAHNNNIWRVVLGVEYWLARDRAIPRGHNEGIAQSLVPAKGKTGPGQWHTLTWRVLMMIAGDIWDRNDKEADRRAYKRFQKVRETLASSGYQTPNLNTSASAGDTVEFIFAGRGEIKVRATDRFVEAARKARANDWHRVNLTDFLGL